MFVCCEESHGPLPADAPHAMTESISLQEASHTVPGKTTEHVIFTIKVLVTQANLRHS